MWSGLRGRLTFKQMRQECKTETSGQVVVNKQRNRTASRCICGTRLLGANVPANTQCHCAEHQQIELCQSRSQFIPSRSFGLALPCFRFDYFLTVENCIANATLQLNGIALAPCWYKAAGRKYFRHRQTCAASKAERAGPQEWRDGRWAMAGGGESMIYIIMIMTARDRLWHACRACTTEENHFDIQIFINMFMKKRY